ncbi:MAG: hypothetical protein JWM11_2437 [Planctomycetaceae bacterium]|nr:hypothetical protein [Planctomycetaceae bacterium]
MYPAGVKEISRGLSEASLPVRCRRVATPPDQLHGLIPDPEGVEERLSFDDLRPLRGRQSLIGWNRGWSRVRSTPG